MTATGAALLLVTGGAVGFLSGLTGIGGGVLMVPLLYAYYAATSPGLAVPAAAAHATSLCVIAPTAARGAYRYGREGLVAWRVAIPMGVGAAVTAAPVAQLATAIPDAALRVGFALFLLFTAAHLLRPSSEAPERLAGADAPGLPIGLAAGAAVGALSALLGVGGGVAAIPLLHTVGRVPARMLAASSLAVIAPAAAAGAISYSLTGSPHMPPLSVGVVHLGAALPLLVGSLALVGLGARVNARVPARVLRGGFATLLVAAALWLIVGVLGGAA